MNTADTKPKRTEGNWRVMRDCCTSGNCVRCHYATPCGKPLRIVQASGYGKTYAQWVAANWLSYRATAERVQP